MIWKISKLTLAGTIIVSLSPSYALGGFLGNIVDDAIPDIQIPGSGPIGDISFDPLDLLQDPEGTLGGLAESIFGDLIGGLLTEVFSGNCDTDPEGGTTNPDMNWMCEAMEPVQVINTDAENFVASSVKYYDESVVNWFQNNMSLIRESDFTEADSENIEKELSLLLDKAGGTDDESRAAADEFIKKTNEIVNNNIENRIKFLNETVSNSKDILVGDIEEEDIQKFFDYAIATDPTLMKDEYNRLQVIRNNSNYLAQSSVNAQRSSEIISRIQEDESLIKSVENTALQAQELINRENAAVSTRAAVQYMGEGIAALMVQQAMQNAQIVESIRTNTIQEAYTTTQLGILVQQMADQAAQNASENMAEYNNTLLKKKADIESSASLLTTIGETAVSITKQEKLQW